MAVVSGEQVCEIIRQSDVFHNVLPCSLRFGLTKPNPQQSHAEKDDG